MTKIKMRWMQMFLVGLLLVIALVMVGCESFDLSQLSDEDLQRIADQAITCNRPYMRFETGCCLDQNANSICDGHEGLSEELSEGSSEGSSEGLERPAPQATQRQNSENNAVPLRPEGPLDSPDSSIQRSPGSALDIPQASLPGDGEDGHANQADTSEGSEEDQAIDSADSAIRYRLFADDRAKIGYLLQFYEPEQGVVAAFGIKEVVDAGKLIAELRGAEYDNAFLEVQLGDTINLLTDSDTDSGRSYSITIENIYAGEAAYGEAAYIDVAVVSLSGKVKNRLFAKDRAKIGYLLQFYEQEQGVVAAFGIKEVVGAGKLIIELNGAEYDNAFLEMQLGDTIVLATEGNTTYSIRIDDVAYLPGNSIVDVSITQN